MSIFQSFTVRMAVLGTFLVVSLGMFVFMLAETSVRVPYLEQEPNQLTLVTDDIENLVPASSVWIAGIQVGEVMATDLAPDGARVTFTVSDEHWPLHEGLNVRIGEKSLVGESYLDVVDGTGAEIEEGSTLPRDVVQPGVSLYDVYDSLDEETRAATSSMIQSLGASTEGTKDEIAATLTGLGALGRDGHTALDAIAAQSADLEKLAAQTTTLLEALDTGQGQIAQMVTTAERVTQATAGQRSALETTMRLLPTTLDQAREASVKLTELSAGLAPVAADLRAAAPELTTALAELPATTADLRGLLPPASGTLDRAPATLERTETFGEDIRGAVPGATAMLRDVNPMLEYIKPYGPDLAAFFANFNAALKPTDENGRHYIRAMLFFNEKTLQSPFEFDLGTYNNPYPGPGAGNAPGPFTGEYPRLERAPR